MGNGKSLLVPHRGVCNNIGQKLWDFLTTIVLDALEMFSWWCVVVQVVKQLSVLFLYVIVTSSK